MKRMKTINVIKKLVNFGIINLLGFNLFLGCVKLVPDLSETYTIDFQMNLPLDMNGYYHLTLDRTDWQTLHRVSGVVKDGMNNLVEGFWVEWDSDLYWYLGDTLGYIYKRGLTSDLVYVNYDTTYVTWFDGFEVPVVNGNSYSNSDLEINTMFAPVKVMSGDTIKVNLYWYDWNLDYNNEDFEIIVN